MDLGDFAEIVHSTHAFIAGFTYPQIAIDREEAELLTRSASNVLAYYKPPKMAAETMAWIRLMHAMGMVYGTRIASIAIERRMARARTVNEPPRAPATAPGASRSTQPPPAPPRQQAQEQAPPPGNGSVNIAGIGSVSAAEANKLAN